MINCKFIKFYKINHQQDFYQNIKKITWIYLIKIYKSLFLIFIYNLFIIFEKLIILYIIFFYFRNI